MASYPNTSVQGALAQALTQLKKNFPSKVDADYLKRFAIGPGNESYIIAILRFLNLIDEDGARLDDNIKFFYGTEEAFQAGLEERLRNAYSHLFEEMGDNALTSEKAPLAYWFRASDKTSELVGLRQASTFLTLAAFAGHGSIPGVKAQQAKKPAEAKPAEAKPAATKAPAKPPPAPNGNSKESKQGTNDHGGGGVNGNGSDVGLTVRIEVNLPPGGDAKTYDAIFASIKKHLMS